jgi:hypothetical protein
MWYVLRVVDKELVQVVVACNTKAKAQSQLEMTRDRVEVPPKVSCYYKLYEGDGKESLSAIRANAFNRPVEE